MTTTRAQAITAAGQALARGLATAAAMTPREQAEAAHTPTSPLSVDELEARIRTERGLPTRRRRAS